ncbi:g3171 [Coccomyxa elongata]
MLPGEVHLWWLFPDDVQDGSLLAQYEHLLTAEEHSHMMAASTPKLRKERLLARVLVRTTLSRYCGAEAHPQSLRFSRNHAGKPHLLRDSSRGVTDLHSLQFNLSHTASLLGCAVTAGQLVGLDVEVTNRHTHGDPLRLAKRRFSPAERAALEGCAEGEERAQHFVRLWTLKEAYVKAVGRGISGRPGLSAFSVSLDPISTGDASQLESPQTATSAPDSRTPPLYNIRFASPDMEQDKWDFLLFSPSAQHTAALCLQRGPAEAPTGTAVQMAHAMLENSSTDV